MIKEPLQNSPVVASPPSSSRISGFYKLNSQDRQKIVANFCNVEVEDFNSIIKHQQNDDLLLGAFIENAIGHFSLPLGIATNFLIDDQEYLIPMAVEESSVVAACSYGAKLCRAAGGFKTTATLPITTGQIQVFSNKNKDQVESIILANQSKLIEVGNACFPRLLERGGGIQDLHGYLIRELDCYVLNIDVHTCDAMGANIVNTMAEKIGAYLTQHLGLEIGLKILTNLSTHRRAKAECEVHASAFARDDDPTGLETIKAIERAYLFAKHDVYRAATHNKGIMNGIDPVVIATGNDWRAVEASAHAWAASQTGRYQSMSYWKIVRGDTLYGSLDLPLPVGTVGGVTRLHPVAKASLNLLKNPGAQKLARIMCAVGLAQNLSALRALSVEGIQAGHMRMHEDNLKLQRKVHTPPPS